MVLRRLTLPAGLLQSGGTLSDMTKVTVTKKAEADAMSRTLPRKSITVRLTPGQVRAAEQQVKSSSGR